MKSIKDLIPAQPGASEQTHKPNLLKSNNDDERAKIIKLWQLMGSMFGHKWVTSYGDKPDPDRVWQATLKGISEESIRKALSEIASNGAEWPPSAPEFKKLCDGTNELFEHRRIAYADRERDKSKLLEHKIDPELRKKKMDLMMRVWRGELTEAEVLQELEKRQ